jgi:DNA-binding transcriptional MerR regulator
MKRYTVKKVAELSGVSVRTLHFYDEIGLLKPALYGENGYRYYEREQLLQLQQILFYRKLGFALEKIRQMLADPKFDKVRALRSHRAVLEKDAGRLRDLIRTVDKTIETLEEGTTMKDQDLYKGFAPEKQEEFEQYLVGRYGKPAQDKIEESRRRMKDWKKEKYEAVAKEGDEVLRGLVGEMRKGRAPDHPDVQKLIELHYRWVCHYWTPNRAAYTGLGRLYVEHPEFRKFYEPYHPELVGYLAEGMRIYAATRLE